VADDSLRDHVIAPILAGVRSPRMGRKPKIWTAVDRDCESLRIGMQTLFQHVGIETLPAGTVCLIGSRHGRETPAADGLAAEVLPRGRMATPLSGRCKLTR
jgi:hypothetical protein